MEDTVLLTQTVARLVRDGSYADLQRVLEEQPLDHIADLIEHVDPSVRDVIFSALEAHRAGEVAARLDYSIREDLLDDLPTDQLVEMVEDLDADDAVTILEDADPAAADEVLRQLDPEDAGELRELLGYDEDSAGRAMAFGAPAVLQDITLGRAIEELRREADEIEELQQVYVIDGAGRLRGYLPLDVLLLRPPDTPVMEAMHTNVTFAYTYEDQETAANRAQRSNLPAIPIIDGRGVLRGQIAHGRLREIVEEETSEDMYRMVGLSEDESVHSTFQFSLQKRLPWLFVNLITAVLAASVVSNFRGLLEKLAILAVLQSIVPGQGGNAAIQTLTITVRGLALGDLDWRNSRRVFLKELGLGVVNGLCVGSTIGLLVWAWQGNPWLGVVIAGAMLLNMVAAAVAGYCVPLALRACKLDPAQASGVFVTTVTDVCGFFFFLGLASLFMPLLGGR
ncbi:MAG: magnesium transporter [Armatimonadetes bacterium]|jgi:magnesium transporter|nr:magnesium transporter [Armatimonadota bacterium]